MELVSTRDEFQPTHVEIEALRKERDVLIETLKNQQLRNRVEETDRNNGFKNLFAKPTHWQQGRERHLVRASHLEFHRDGDFHFNGTRLC